MGVVLLIDQVAAEDLDSTDEEIDTRLPGLDTVSSCMRIVDSTVPSQSGNCDGPGLSRSICLPALSSRLSSLMQRSGLMAQICAKCYIKSDDSPVRCLNFAACM